MLDIYHDLSTSSNLFFFLVSKCSQCSQDFIRNISKEKTHAEFHLGSLVIKKLLCLAKPFYMGNIVCSGLLIINKKNNEDFKFQRLFRNEVLRQRSGKNILKKKTTFQKTPTSQKYLCCQIISDLESSTNYKLYTQSVKRFNIENKTNTYHMYMTTDHQTNIFCEIMNKMK